VKSVVKISRFVQALQPGKVCRSIRSVKVISISAIMFAGLMLSHAEMQAPVPLWPEGAPGALGTSSNDIPTLTAYLPGVTNATHTAMVICPGGAYENVDPGGNGCALWLNQHGVTCFVLKYRVSSHGYHHPAMLDDATRAVRWVRAHADKFNVDQQHIGIMGVSAGAHLATTLMTHFDMGDPKAADPVERQSSRPDFGVLCYAVITTMGEFVNQVSHDNLLGPNAPAKLEKELSNDLHVTSETPPCFLWTSFGDYAAPMENSIMFAEALRKNRVQFELHIYERGRHGVGLKLEPPFTNPHPGLVELQLWLKEHKWANY
jgi:acetyl esterase/lipase